MPHILIVGMTESGKTTLAKQMVTSYKAKGVPTLLLDPLSDPEWNTEHKFRDSQAFLNVVKKSRSCFVVVDESGDAIGKYGGAMNQLATRGRHYGHNCAFITQRAQQLDTTIRAQCSILYMFASSKKDCQILAEEFNCDMLLQGNALKKGEFIKAGRFVEPQKLRLF